MNKSERRAEYDRIFLDVDEGEKALADKLIGECVYYETEMEKLKALPFIAVNPKNQNQQRMTAAAKLYKEYATSYMNGIRILLNILRKVESTAQDDLLRRLEEFQ